MKVSPGPGCPVQVGRHGGVGAENNTKGPAGTILSSIGPVSLDGGLDSSSLILLHQSQAKTN